MLRGSNHSQYAISEDGLCRDFPLRDFDDLIESPPVRSAAFLMTAPHNTPGRFLVAMNLTKSYAISSEAAFIWWILLLPLVVLDKN